MRISDWSSDVCSSDLPGLHNLLLFIVLSGAASGSNQRLLVPRPRDTTNFARGPSTCGDCCPASGSKDFGEEAAPAPVCSLNRRRSGNLVRWLLLWAGLALAAAPAASARMVEDSAGRRVEVPDRVERVFAAG